jgi:two-component system phosphate regulon response regulator PhoB
VSSAKRILVVEDERDLADLLTYNLKKNGFDAIYARDGNAALAALRSGTFDLVILDLMLPGVPGIEIARQIRTNPRIAEVPILILTARADEADQLTGLAVGADDYVTKPFSMKVLLARVQALLRRKSGSEAHDSRLQLGPVMADLASHSVAVDGKDTKLTLTEFKLLTALLQSPSRVLSRSELINRVMGPGIIVTARTIDVHVAALRRKLGQAGSMIRTIRGVGYQITTVPETTEEARQTQETSPQR